MAIPRNLTLKTTEALEKAHQLALEVIEGKINEGQKVTATLIGSKVIFK